jgi:WD40 repeat protein
VQRTTTRHIPSQPERILDAPDLESDYYLNLLDWSAQNVLAVALGPTVYLWNATDGSINELCSLGETDGKSLWVKLFGVWYGAPCSFLLTEQLLFFFFIIIVAGQFDKVCSVSWVPGDGNFLAVGTSNNVVQLWDVNEGKKLRSMDGHQDRVSSLAWNKHVLSSGSRDSLIVNHDVRVRDHKVSTFKGHTQ